MKTEQEAAAIENLCNALISIDNFEDMYNLLRDLCTPQEIKALAERWNVCKLLHKGDSSYREIRDITGASLTTIGRVSRFLKDESYNGYANLIKKMQEEEQADD